MMRCDDSGQHNAENKFKMLEFFLLALQKPGTRICSRFFAINFNTHIAAVRSSGTQDNRVETVKMVA